MLNDNDIGRLFAVMAAAYGNQWKHQADAAEVWLRKLGGFNRKDILIAASTAIDQYKQFPPTLGQFTEIVSGPPKRANTYLPAPESTRARSLINKILVKVLTEVGGVDSFQLHQLVSLKNALLEDLGKNVPSLEWSHSAYDQLTAIARSCDRDIRRHEVEVAEARYRIRQGA